MKAFAATFVIAFALGVAPALAQEAKPDVPAPAPAQAGAPNPDADNDFDMRCLMVSFMLAQQTTDPAARQALTAAGLYYLGRLDGRAPNYDFGTHAVDAVRHLSAEQVATERVRCGSYMTNRGHVLVQIGQDLAAQAQQDEQTHRQQP